MPRSRAIVALSSLLFGLCCLLLRAEGPPRVKGVRFTSGPDYTRVVVDLDSLAKYRPGRLSSPERLFVDFPSTLADAGWEGRQIPVSDGLVHRIRIGQPQSGGTRVVLDLGSSADPHIFTLNNPPRLVVDLKRASTPPPALEVKPVPSTAGSLPPVAPPAKLPEPAKRLEALPALAAATPPPGLELPRLGPIVPAPSVAIPLLPFLPVKPSGPERSVRIPKVSRPPKLEDFLNGVPREAGARVTDFRQREPRDGRPASQETLAYLSYDDRNVYVVFVCKDEPGNMRAHMAKREQISGDDRVGVYLDTFRDRQRAYLFAANALGVQRDGVLTEGQAPDYRFDTRWHSEGRLTGQGFVVWMAIPFQSLRFPGGARQTWGIALGRSMVRNNENSYWPHISTRVQGFVQQMGDLDGLEEISPGRNVQMIPYGFLSRARLLDAGKPAFFNSKDEWRGGLDSKVVLRDALALDLTLNPDFSQVESDDPQVIVNRRFEVMFPEKRPFFLENAGFFETPQSLFFSRRIADPEFGGRLTGKVGRWAIGALAADDRAPGRSVSPTDPLYGRHAVIGVARVQREFASQSYIGLLATGRDFGPVSNRVVSVDTRLKLNPNWVLTGQAIRSYDRRAGGRRLSGPSYAADLRRNGRHFAYAANYLDRSPDFRAALGFIPRTDVRQMGHYAGYLWRPEGSRVLSFGPSISTSVNWDRRGRVQDWVTYGEFAIDLSGPTGITFSRYDAMELYSEVAFRNRKTGVSFYSSPLKWLLFYGSFAQGANVNYSPPYGLLPYLATATDGSFGFTLRPAPRILFDQVYYYSRLGTRPAGASIFNNHLWRSKLNYQFSRALSARFIVDYYGLLPNPSLVAQQRFQRVSGDFLLTYLLNPGTALYIGYADRFDNLALDPTAPSRLRLTGSPTLSTGRQFFVKVSYLFRF